MAPEQLEGIRKRRRDIYDVAQHVRIHPEIPRVDLLEMFAADVDGLLAEIDELTSWKKRIIRHAEAAEGRISECDKHAHGLIEDITA